MCLTTLVKNQFPGNTNVNNYFIKVISGCFIASAKSAKPKRN